MVFAVVPSAVSPARDIQKHVGYKHCLFPVVKTSGTCSDMTRGTVLRHSSTKAKYRTEILSHARWPAWQTSNRNYLQHHNGNSTP